MPISESFTFHAPLKKAAMQPDPLAHIRTLLASGYSVYDLARLSGVPRSTIQGWLDRGLPDNVRAFQRVMVCCTEGPPSVR
jgi:transposase-like protein